MRFEMIRHNKMKVTVENDDLEKWGITADEIAKNTPQTREIFFELLRQAEKETGFSCNNARLVVEAAVCSDSNELTLFVTKVDSEEEKALFEKISSGLKAEKASEGKKTEKYDVPVGTMIELEEFEDVISMCHVMRECLWGSLYSYKDKYYMTMLPSYITKASEFGRVCSDKYRYIVEEHGKPLVKNSAFLFIRNRFES